MLKYSLLLASALSICYCQSFLDSTLNHLAVCYNDTLFTEERILPPQSLDNLISIIEKVELHFRSNSPDFIAGYLLKKFRIDGIKQRQREGRDPPEYGLDGVDDHRRGTLVSTILSYRDTPQYDSVNYLTKQEICGLHWMLSHTINDTRMLEETYDINWRPSTPPYRRRRQTYPQQVVGDKSKYPRESGLIYTADGEAVAAGSVLAGIAMMTDPDGVIKLYDLDKSIQDPALRELPLNRLHAVTYGVNLALPAFRNERNPQLGPKGFWNETICPTEYTLNSKDTLATNAIVYGAFDGFFLAEFMSSNRGADAKLSQILRMYYGTVGHGFPGRRDLRSCNRIALMQNLLREKKWLVEREIKYSLLALGLKNLQSANETASHVIEGLQKNFTSGYVSGNTECGPLDGNAAQKVNPQVDLYIVLERRILDTQTIYDEVAKFVTYLADKLDIGSSSSHIGLYVDDKNLNSLFPLNMSQSEAEWKCDVKRKDVSKRLPSQIEDPVQTIHALKKMFRDIKYDEKVNKQITGAPAKVLLFVRTTGVRHHPSKEGLLWEMEMFRKDHPDIRILAAASSHAHVDVFVPNQQADFIRVAFVSGTDQRIYAQQVYDKLAKTGAIVYNPYCEKDQNGFSVDGFLPPFSRQYHTLQSQIFNYTKSLTIEVRKISSDLKVCFSREDNIFNPTYQANTRGCIEIDNAYTKGFGDPCAGYSAGYCPPIYLMVQRKNPNEETFVPCKSSSDITSGKYYACRTYEDARYQIKVEGARCGGYAIKIAMNVLIACLMLSFLSKFN